MADLKVPQIVPHQTSAAAAVVTEKFDFTKEIIDETYDIAIAALNDMKDVILAISNIDTTITLDDISLDPSINLEELLQDMPENPIEDSEYDDLVVPTNLFTYVEDNYVSELISPITTKLLEILNNGDSGLNATVEQQMFDRETERENQVLADTKDRIASDWAEKGQDLPGGGLYRVEMQADVDLQNRRLDKNRAITEETRRIAIENTRLVWQEIRALEAILISQFDSKMGRKLNAAIQVMNEGLSLFNAALDKLKTKASVYASQVAAFASHADALTAVANAQVAAIRAKIEFAVAKANAAIASLNAQIVQLEINHKINLGANESIAKIAAQITASYGSAVAATAHISSTLSRGVSSNISAIEEWSHRIEE